MSRIMSTSKGHPQPGYHTLLFSPPTTNMANALPLLDVPQGYIVKKVSRITPHGNSGLFQVTVLLAKPQEARP